MHFLNYLTSAKTSKDKSLNFPIVKANRFCDLSIKINKIRLSLGFALYQRAS